MIFRYSIEKDEDINYISRTAYNDNGIPIDGEAYPIENEDYEMLNNVAGHWDFSRIARLVWKIARLENAEKI